MKNNISAHIANKDILELAKKEKIKVSTKCEKHKYISDHWFVHGGFLYNKESTRLNKELGINRLNYLGNTNSKQTKTT
jgi:hypothetical protein